MWTAVGITRRPSRQNGDGNIFQQELSLLKRKGLFPKDVPVIVVDDPTPGLGSGGSTLNALLVLVEHVCAKKHFTVLQPEVLHDSNFLIIHLGGEDFPFDPCGRAFVDFPAVTVTESGTEVTVNNFVHLYTMVTRLSASVSSRSGVWVCGSDGVLILDPNSNLPQFPSDISSNKHFDILAFSIPVSQQYAHDHGVYKVNNQNFLEDVVYRGELSRIAECSISGSNSQVPLTLALLFMSDRAAESILRLHDVHPLICSTYLGEDSGNAGFKLSLFFDFLLPTCSNVSEHEFVFGQRDSLKGQGDHCESRTDFVVDVLPLARKLLWDALRSFKTYVVTLKPLFYHYLTNDPCQFIDFLRNVQIALSKIVDYKVWRRPLINSYASSHKECKCILYNCLENSDEQSKCCRSSGVFCFLDLDKNLSLSSTRDPAERLLVRRFVDSRGENKNSDECKKFCFEEFSFDLTDQEQKIPYVSSNNVVDLTRHFRFKREISSLIRLDYVKRVLCQQLNVCLLPTFSSLCLDGYEDTLFETLHSIVVKVENSGVRARTLSCVADVLGILAQGEGGLRSGPSLQKNWAQVLENLENENDLSQSMSQLDKLRKQWSDSPFRMIRAARHLEAAAQIFLRKTVKLTKQFVQIQKNYTEPSFDKFYWATAAARVDLAGGWSDTPPITYEHGGAVLNMAIEIDGKKPVGAKTKRVQEPIINALCLSDGNIRMNVVFRRLSDIRETYANPSAPGALVAAAVVCAELVDWDKNGEEELDEQLKRKFGGGFEIHFWSNLPQGSGLGTSSILAGCILASLWNSVGVQFDLSSVLHGVLYIEQLLTTGGGWQDQVGGLCPGLKVGRFGNTFRIEVENCALSSSAVNWLNERLLLVYTGKTRLAKNLLQEVVRSWYARKRDIVDAVDDLVANAEKCKIEMENENWDLMSDCVKTYWNQKKFFAPGCEPATIGNLIEYLYKFGLVYCAWLAGAGGGGFLYLISKEARKKIQIEKILKENENWRAMTVHEVRVDLDPFLFYET